MSIQLRKLGGAAIIDAEALAAELRRQLGGEVRFDAGSRALYATDSSNYRQVPIGVVIPKDVDDVIKTVAICRRHGTPLLARGGGTSLAGQCCNVAVVIDMSKYMNKVIEIDPEKRLAQVQPGTILDDLRYAAEQFHLTFGPDPSTHSYCTLGGMIGNDSCGTHSVMAGKTVDNIEELEVLTYDGLRMRVGKTSDEELERIIEEGGRRGEIYASLKALRDNYANLIRERYPNIPRRVSGYNLDQLLPENGFHVARALVGTENTCVTVLEATVRLVKSPPARALLVLGYPDIYRASEDLMEILAHEPIALEGMDDRLIENAKRKKLLLSDIALLPPGGGWLLVEFGSDTMQESVERARGLMEEMRRKEGSLHMRLFDNPGEAKKIWLVREAAVGATGSVPGEKEVWPGWEDSAVPPDKVADYLRDLRKLFEQYDYRFAFYGHFGQGCIHTRIGFDFETSAGIKKFRAFMNDAADLVVKYGGSLSGEHGDGQARAELLPKMFGEELAGAFREFMAKQAEHYQLPQLHAKAVVHGHCHQKAIMKMTGEEAVLAKLGLDYIVLDSGCCGMAGAFGFEKDHYEVSIKIGERVLLPAVRGAGKDTLIIADGFSCREQIAQTTDRRALHVAEVIQMAMRGGTI